MSRLDTHTHTEYSHQTIQSFANGECMWCVSEFPYFLYFFFFIFGFQHCFGTWQYSKRKCNQDFSLCYQASKHFSNNVYVRRLPSLFLSHFIQLYSQPIDVCSCNIVIAKCQSLSYYHFIHFGSIVNIKEKRVRWATYEPDFVYSV